ncbi:MAG: 50S ribosomal protein L35 [Candidatus Phytoplasma stylosanthis]|uniref:50S ribosomal protein L35 n=1 Tax=Candidatus Phytoplasma stylosanthis TaxID=2798314 RepID=UPI002939A2F7|nr:50S ribosomal protein L35 [Candidatus Phytoplasma stylosanthis]MDV3168078.1 50S ribosomal protein L35 [Candidatus Phytoplasma stylosanthis]MDV3170684.1 50S ribosomal protein L35 [Candidatus Phytoplasma stylosanthis]MDV3173777.1 50S ribosomal protein L35 [Candidatus Phytoplasma stylosanthis]MDV3174345.1 50S ribosomal protein L35 [Candidatus Phytoplasma stylosanthis]MDV3195952.1 50S ribosomal protein L35 [Candidatus Phytoplasma stylosanthis]
MIKKKVHKGLKKRIKITGTGKFLRRHAFKNHLAGSKTTKQNRKLRQATLVDITDVRRIKYLI